MCPRGLLGPPAVTLTKKLKFKKKLPIRCIRHFESDLINNMDHMRISDTEPSSVILSQTMQFKKLKSDNPKVPKQAEAKRDGVINPQNYNFNIFIHGKFGCSKNATNQSKSTVELGYMCPRGLSGSPAVTLNKKLKFERRLSIRCIHHFELDLINNMDHMRISGTEPSSVILSQTMQF